MAVPIVNVADTIVVRQVAKNTAQYGMNILNYSVIAAAGAPVTVGDVATFFDANRSPVFLDLLSAAAKYWGYGVRKFNISGSPEYYADAASAFGTGGANLLPTQSAPLVSWRTDQADRSGRGRSYIPFAATDALQASAAITVAYNTLMDAWANAMQGPITIPNAAVNGTIDIVLAIVDKLLTHKYPVTRFVIRTFLATQRRREELNRADNNPFNGSIHV